jgi:hypothetical protein
MPETDTFTSTFSQRFLDKLFIIMAELADAADMQSGAPVRFSAQALALCREKETLSPAAIPLAIILLRFRWPSLVRKVGARSQLSARSNFLALVLRLS